MEDRELLLGQKTPPVSEYSPQLLFPIERKDARLTLGFDPDSLPFHGEDIWHAYELSWMQAEGRPVARVGRFGIPAHSPMLVESKSFKLYLNSLNFLIFKSDADAVSTIQRDVSRVAGAQVNLELFKLDDPALSGSTLPGVLLDDSAIEGETPAQPSPNVIELTGSGDGVYHSHLLRSLCPVTGQPDWGSVLIEIEGAKLAPASLLRYLLSYRQHQEFHEQCVERIFRDIARCAVPTALRVQAFYTRRGGMDISPWRSSSPGKAPRLRLNRQ